MKRAEALKFCKQALARYEKAKAPPSVLTSARNLLYWIEDNKIERPFADPYFWGASTIFGSGWHLPAGATVGDPLTSIENMMRLDNAEGMLRDWKAAEAYETARDVAARSDGSTRGHACTTMAWARMIGADLGNRQRARIEARRLLHAAERIAKGEEDRKLLKRVQWMRERMEKDYVVENDD
jgi:hypothetical protein